MDESHKIQQRTGMAALHLNIENPRALDDIHTDWQNIITIFDQDGFTVDVPHIDISGICKQIGQAGEWRQNED